MGVSIKYSLLAISKTSHILRRTVWCYSQGDFDKANELIYHANLESIGFENMSVDDNWSAWQSSFLNIISVCAPKRVIFEVGYPGTVYCSPATDEKTQLPFTQIQSVQKIGALCKVQIHSKLYNFRNVESKECLYLSY